LACQCGKGNCLGTVGASSCNILTTKGKCAAALMVYVPSFTKLVLLANSGVGCKRSSFVAPVENSVFKDCAVGGCGCKLANCYRTVVALGNIQEVTGVARCWGWRTVLLVDRNI